MQFQIKCVKGQNKKHQPIRLNVELKVASIDETKNQQQKTLFPLNLWFMDWSRKYVSVTLREEYNFLDQQRLCFFSLKFIYIP